MRNFLPTFSPAYASAMRRGFLRLRGFCAPSPVAQAAAFRPAAVSPAPTFFAVRRFVRFIQPAPNPALKRTCAKSRAARLALRWVRSFPFAYHLRMRNLLPTFSPAYASAMRRGFLRLRGFCALSPVAQAAAFRPAAVSPAPTFFAVRRFVRFIQPAPNPALKRTCAKSRAARLALR